MKLSINLASHRYLNQQLLKLIFSCIIVFLLFILVIQGNSYLRNRQQVLQYQAQVDSLQEQLRGKLPERLTPVALAEQHQAYERVKALLQRDAFRWTVLFDRIENLLPAGVSLRSFNPDYGKSSLLIKGVVRDLKILQALLNNLQSAQFNRVYLKNQGEIDVDDGHGSKRKALSFSISLGGVF